MIVGGDNRSRAESPDDMAAEERAVVVLRYLWHSRRGVSALAIWVIACSKVYYDSPFASWHNHAQRDD